MMSRTGGPTLLGKDAIAAAIKSGNVNIASSMQVEVMDLSEESRAAQQKHAESLRGLEAQQRARSIIVPTAIDDVKAKLRDLGHPVTLFGEGHADRRERLREVIAKIELKSEEVAHYQAAMNQTSHSSAQASTDQRASSAHAHQKEAFYSPAADILIAARRSIAEWSIARAHARILKTKEIRTSAVLQQIEDKTALDLYDKNKQMTLCASEFGDSRALTTVRYSASGDFLATGSLACNVKIWDSSASKCRGELVGHVERITSVAWMPPGVQESHRNFLASTAADSSCILWDTSLLTRRAVNASSNNDGEEMGLIGSRSGPMVQKFIGHQGVISDCDIHPMGRHIGTAGQDFTWRLWDIETGSEVLLQDGHIKECSSISFQCDGSLVLTTDWAGVALLWDLRSGQCIHVFQGHVQKIVSSCFSPNGFQVATGSIDHMVRIWDLRKKKCWYTLPAHSNVISDLKFSKSGELLLTSSFDGTTKLWNSRDFDLIRTLSGHNGKVMGCDISPNELEVATAGFDRTLKIWGKQ